MAQVPDGKYERRPVVLARRATARFRGKVAHIRVIRSDEGVAASARWRCYRRVSDVPQEGPMERAALVGEAVQRT